MTERRRAILLSQYADLVAWQVEAWKMPADAARQALEAEGLCPERAQQIVMQAINRRPPQCSSHY